jgi:type II secretory pathway predicted ATPase ExeA
VSGKTEAQRKALQRLGWRAHIVWLPKPTVASALLVGELITEAQTEDPEAIDRWRTPLRDRGLLQLVKAGGFRFRPIFPLVAWGDRN